MDSSGRFEADDVAAGAEIWVPAWSVLCFEIKSRETIMNELLKELAEKLGISTSFTYGCGTIKTSVVGDDVLRFLLRVWDTERKTTKKSGNRWSVWKKDGGKKRRNPSMS